MNLLNQFGATVAGLLLLGNAGAVPLQNGDFASFDGWTGTKTNEDPTGTFNTVILTGEAQINPDTQFVKDSPATGLADMINDPITLDGYFELSLFQEFDLPANALGLAFDFDWKLSDIGFDLVGATLGSAGSGVFLEDLLANVVIDLTSDHAKSGSTSVDISAHAGQTVVLEFLLQDGDFWGSPLLGDNADSFAIGNIIITEQPASVPVPAPLALLGIGLLGMGASRPRKTG